MKKLLFVVFFFASLGLFAQQNPALITVTGKGTVNVTPDKVLIKARVEHTGKSASEVKAQNDKVVNDIIKYLKSQGIPSKNFQTEYLNLNKDYNYNTKETFYSANQAISIQLNDLSKYETLMGGLLNSGLNRIDGIQFQTSKREKLESEARKKAVLNALEKAKEYAGALGQEVGKAHSISEMDNGNFPPMYRALEMQDSASSKQETIAPGEMEVTVKVNVSFLLK
ncbi:SIMPL domain-containing protein [Salinimicrobium soli]|uniref:SIMPL domain-containing protein n=1 Tax=Salinimicrobium soli TaxID=1254399 RepID=UPI003AACB592